jgi:hypothetical protein
MWHTCDTDILVEDTSENTSQDKGILIQTGIFTEVGNNIYAHVYVSIIT